ncbi:MAG: AraC family transcriptional regulator [Blautia sp.]|nr:AraC family transcriptional regulator [Blautia sp.]
MKLIDFLPDSSEVIHYNIPHLPVSLEIKTLDLLSRHLLLSHWHEDIEILRVLHGSMKIMIGSEKHMLRARDCFIINSRQLHGFVRIPNETCLFQSIHIDLGIFVANKTLHLTLISPVFYRANNRYYKIAGTEARAAQLQALFDQLFRLEQERLPGYPLEMTAYLYHLLSFLYSEFHNESGASDDNDMDSLNNMVTFISRYYDKKIQLDDIARAGNMCRSRCCSFFKTYFDLTPNEFLVSYRLSISKDMLLTTDDKISHIAAACGFPHQSYFSKLFTAKYGYTPNDYRRQNIKDSPNWLGG